MHCVNNPENNETISKILEEMNYAEQFLLNWKAYWYERYENIILPENFSLMPSDVQEELGLNIYAHFIKYDKKGSLVPLRNVEVANNYGVCTIEWNGITTNKCSRRIAFNSDGNITLEKDKRDFSKRKLDYSSKYNVVNDDFEIKLVEAIKEGNIFPKIDFSTTYIEKKGNVLTKTTKKGDHIEFRYNLLSGEKSIYIYTRKATGKVNGIYKLDIKDNQIDKITFYSRKGNKQELINDYNCEQLSILLNSLGANGLLNIEMFNKIENKIDLLVKEIISEIPIKGLRDSINKNYRVNIKQQSLSRKENTSMLKDLVNITNEEIEEAAQNAVESGPYITDEGDYYANELCKINLGAASCEAIINDKTPFPEGVYRPAEPRLIKVKKKTK